MRHSHYELICAVLLGLGQLCMFSGYDTQSFVVEPVLHSVHDRDSGRIDAHAGYYGTSLCWFIFTIACIIAPSIWHMCGSKITLVLGSATFTLYLASFFYVHFIPFYLTNILMGVGFALYYTGNGGYLTEHSSRLTIERNSALSWAIAASCMIVGGIVMLFTITPPSQQHNIALNMSELSENVHEYRQYSDFEIRVMYGAFAFFAFLSNIIFGCLPKRNTHNSLAEVADHNTGNGFANEIKTTIRAIGHRTLLQLAPVFTFLGISTGFWIVVFPTTLIFTKKLTSFVYLPAYYSIVLGSGDMFMGFLISFLSRRIKNFGQKPTIIMGSILYMSAFILTLLSIPPWSTNTPNDDSSLLIEPSFGVALLIALLFGLADNCINTSRTIICALVIPDKRAQVFSVSKFYQNIGASLLMFVSPWMSIPMYFIVLSINCALAVYFYLKIADETKDWERKVTFAATESARASVHPIPAKKFLGTPTNI